MSSISVMRPCVHLDVPSVAMPSAGHFKAGLVAVVAAVLAFSVLSVLPAGASVVESATFTVTSASGAAENIWADGSAVAVSDRFVVTEGAAEGVTFGSFSDASGAQGLLRLDSAGAPTQFRFEGAVPQGHAAAVQADGSVSLMDPTGAVVGSIAAPWAFDADGIAVSTSYAVEGTTLVQTIEHHETSAYPVVADPDWTRVAATGSAAVLGVAVKAPVCVVTAGIGCYAAGALSLAAVNAVDKAVTTGDGKEVTKGAACGAVGGVPVVGKVCGGLLD